MRTVRFLNALSITGVVLRGEMELMGSPVFCPAQHLETVTKIKTVKSVCPGLP